ncbi:class I adenylate-forming enzyme family protein [Candidatus Electronema sp. JC]|uniref:class I adenylate-forming enzyme family protein n=1 Tax=Candidatus Electronema sp. JC TaxID=3401570 RepID=UPI003B434DF6
MPFPEQSQTLTEALLRRAETTPGKVFIRSGRGHFSYQQTWEQAARLASFLAAQELTADARICLLLPRAPELIFSFLAARLAGCLPAPVNYLDHPERVRQAVLAVAPAVIIVDENAVSGKVTDSLRDCGAAVISLSAEPGDSSFLRWADCLSCAPLAEPKPQQFDSLAYLNFTSGSTGQAKAALCTEANLYWNTRAAAEAFQLTAEDVHLCMFAAFAHPHELFCRALYTGGSLALLPEISPKAVIRVIREQNVTCMMGLAALYKMMAGHCGSTALPSLRIAESGGMFTPPALHRSFLAAFQTPLLAVWGSTETTGIALANTLSCRRADGSLGRVCPHYQARVADELGRDVPLGETGELLLAGPGVVSGYWGGVPLSAEDGWCRSGDLVRQDAEGFFHFVERKSGLIKVAGLKVYPLQVEQALLEHPGIREAAVVGMEEKRHGCVPKAFVVPQPGVLLEEEELTRHCKGRLAAYMVPKAFRLLEALPTTGSGKIDKKALLSAA